MSSRFDDACAAAAASLIEAITSGDVGEWNVPWHSPGGLAAPQNAVTGNIYHTGACGVFEPCQCPSAARLGVAS